MRILILGSNSNLHCGWTTMTKGLREGFNVNNIESFVLEGINRYTRDFHFNNPIFLSYHVRTNFISFSLDFLRIFFFTLFYRPNHILIIPELLSLPTFLVSKILRVKYSIYSAGTYSSIILEKKWRFAKKAFNSSQNIFPMSEYTKNRIKNKTNNKRIFTVYAGYNDKEYFVRNLDKEKYSIIYVGNLKKRKGFKILCESVLNLPLKIRKNIFIRLIGDFDKKEFYKFSKRLGSKKVKYKIYKNITDTQLSILFNKSHVNVLPSVSEDQYYEGFGIVHSEAIASNCITIGSLKSGNECAIMENNGYLINQGRGSVKELTNLFYKIFSSSSIQFPNGKRPLIWEKVTKNIISKLK